MLADIAIAGQHEDSLVSCNNKRKINPAAVSGYLNEAEALFAAGHCEKARTVLLCGIDQASDKRSLYVKLIEYSSRFFDFSSAFNYLTTLKHKFPLSQETYAAEVALRLSISDFIGADKAAVAAMESYPSEFWAHELWAENAMRERNAPEAARRWRSIRSIFPNEIAGYLRGAKAFSHMAEFGKSELLITVAERSASSSLEVLSAKAELEMSRHNWPSAEHCWQLVRDRYPQNPIGYLQGALASRYNGNRHTATSLEREAVLLFQEDAEVQSLPARQLIKSGNHAGAVHVLGRLCERFPSRFDFLINLGNSLLDLKRLGEARNVFQKILSLNPYNMDAKVKLASIKWTNGDESSAINDLFEIFDQNSTINYFTPAFFWEAYTYCLKMMQNGQWGDATLKVLKLLLHEPLRYETECFHFHRLHSILAVQYSYDKVFNFLQHAAKEVACETKNDQLSDYISLMFDLIEDRDKKVELYFYFFSCASQKNRHSLVKYMIYNKHETFFSDWVFHLLKSNKIDLIEDSQLIYFILGVSSISDDLMFDVISGIAARYAEFNIDKLFPLGFISEIDKNRKEGLTAAAQNIPAIIHARGERLRIAICVSGQLRGFKEAHSTWGRLQMTGHTVETYVHTWKNIGRHFPTGRLAYRAFTGNFLNAFRQLPQITSEFFKCYYPNFYNLLVSEQVVTKEQLAEEYQTDSICLEDDSCEPFTRFSNHKKQYYKMQSCFHSIPKTAQYDLIVRIRPDYKFTKLPAIDWHEILYESTRDYALFTMPSIRSNRIVQWAVGLPTLGSIDDNFAVGHMKAMEPYFNTYSTLYQENPTAHIFCNPAQLSGHTSISWSTLAAGLSIKTFQPAQYATARFVNPNFIDINLIYSAILDDVKMRKQLAEDAILISACEQDIGLNGRN